MLIYRGAPYSRFCHLRGHCSHVLDRWKATAHTRSDGGEKRTGDLIKAALPSYAENLYPLLVEIWLNTH